MIAGLRERFDLAVSRGVAKLPVLLEYTLPFCRVGGGAALLKRNVQREVDGAAAALVVLGGRMGDIHPVQLPGLDDGRVIVTVDKVGGHARALPPAARHAGQAAAVSPRRRRDCERPT